MPAPSSRDLQPQARRSTRQRARTPARPGVAGGVGQRLQRDAVRGDLDRGRQRRQAARALDDRPRAEPARPVRGARRPAQLVQDRRAQVVDEPADVGDGLLGLARAGRQQVRGRAGGRGEPRGGRCRARAPRRRASGRGRRAGRGAAGGVPPRAAVTSRSRERRSASVSDTACAAAATCWARSASSASRGGQSRRCRVCTTRRPIVSPAKSSGSLAVGTGPRRGVRCG